jgi:hypothetical protein
MKSLLLLAALGSYACGVPTEGCVAGTDLTGTWRYSAVQDAPAGTTLSGTLAITRQTCGSFSGQLDVVQTTPQGGGQRIGGPVSGRVIDASSIRFDATLEALPRQHLATIAGDSLTGTWLLIDGQGHTVNGTFGSRRETH